MPLSILDMGFLICTRILYVQLTVKHGVFRRRLRIIGLRDCLVQEMLLVGGATHRNRSDC